MTTTTWHDQLRSEAFKTYEATAWPARNHENWRFGSFKKARFEDLPLAKEGESTQAAHLLENSLRFVFQNHELVERPDSLPAGLTALPLSEALQEFGDCLEKKFPKLQGSLGSAKLAAYHRAHAPEALVLLATADIETPVEIIHQISGHEQIVLPHLLITSDEGGHLRVVERFISTNENDATRVVSVTDVVAEKNSQVTYLATQELNRHSLFTRLADSRVEQNALGRIGVVHTGAEWVREETYSTVDGTDGRSEILSVAIPDTGQEYDQRTFQHHGARDTFSDLLFKNTLFGEAKTVFSGLIFVDEHAHGTDAYQTCRNLLMTDTCEANSMPGLEINADEVKCSHGSTSSQVSKEEIYYLMARGIPATQARRLIAKGFSVEVIQKLDNEALEELAIAIVEAKFAQVG
ncbi:MAG: SufB/SufD family protein [Verrucomicrobiales bacterium]